MKCKNCGAELNNGYCEYCGSFFAEHQKYVVLKKLATANIPPKSALKVVGILPDFFKTEVFNGGYKRV